MKRTEKVNIAGMVFHLDEDAYRRLHNYLETLRKKFGSGSEANEILEDIEARIAEILMEKTQKRESVTISDVEEVIRIMGNPEEYEETNGNNASESRSTTDHRTVHRRLYRDPDHTVFGGVCSGLGAYFNVDPILFRILFIVLLVAWGITGILYIILWIALPQALTASQKLEMRGEPVNIGNIERTIRDEYDASAQMGGKGDGWERIRSAFGALLNGILLVIRGILKVIGLVLGFAFTLAGLALLFAFVSMVVVQKPLINGAFDDARFYLTDLVHIFLPGTDSMLLITGLVLFIAIPLVALVYWGLKMLFRFKAQDKWIGVAMFMVWFFAAFLLVMIGISTGERYQKGGEVEKTLALDSLKKQHLIIEMTPFSSSELKKKNSVYFEKDQVAFYYLRDEQRIYGRPMLHIERTDDKNIEVRVSLNAQGRSYNEASENAALVQYQWGLKDSLLELGPIFSLPRGAEWNGSNVDINIYMPVGSEIDLPSGVNSILDWVETADWESRHHLGGKRWRMTDEGLTEVR